MHKNITSTIFYSLLFAMGGAPTIAMMLILSQKHDPNIMYQAFIGLSVIFACILVPLILIQNAYLLYKRKNPEMEEKVEVVSKIYLGLIFFPLNKILISYLNGLRCMKAFSILQAMRYLVVMALVTAIAASELPIELATFCFVAAELLTATLALIYIKHARLVDQLSFSREWVLRHYRFGTKGLAAGMFAEVNSRIDVLLIGFFLSDKETGIYSFAAMLVDGVYHVLAMIRINFNPILVAAARDNDWSAGQYLRRQSLRIVLPVTLLMSILLVLSYYILGVWVMPPEKGILDGLPTLVILLSALVMVSFLVPFDNLLMVSGLPGFQTFQQLILVGVNIVVAVLLLPIIGVEGAAFGTALSYISGILAMVFFVRHRLGWNLINNKLEL